MYKLFLTFRYLTRKKIVIFPVLVVWLCVMMLIIVTSIMGGFVDRVRDANRDIFGDIIISSGASTHGFAGYDALRADLKAKMKDEIEATTPVVEAYSILYAPRTGQSFPSLLVGVNPEERSQVARFRESLYFEYQAPMQAVEDFAPALPATREKLQAFADGNVQKARLELAAAFDTAEKLEMETNFGGQFRARPNARWGWGLLPTGLLLALLLIRARRQHSGWAYFTAGGVTLVCLAIVALGFFWPVIFPRQYDLAEDRIQRADLALAQAERTGNFLDKLGTGDTVYKTRQDLIDVLVVKQANFDVPPELVNNPDKQFAASPDGCIVGTLIMSKRDVRGNFIHSTSPIDAPATITVFPPSDNGKINTGAEAAFSRKFTIIDDGHTGVYDIDSAYVYAPFEIVQQMAGMRADPELVKKDPTANFDPLCHEILIKLKPAALPNIRAIRAKIGHYMDDFVQEYAEKHPESRLADLTVQTWDEKQAKYLGAVENEKVMMTFILLLMSGVVVIVIFLIFYQIVRDKTRDIGIIKAVGGSEEGVAGIFLTYGLFVGVVGGGLGILTGVLFVTHTNQIHEWIYQMTGIIIWDRSVYLFDRIPDTVYSSDVITYFVVALVAGVIGALIPAVIAGSEDPVQAVRYE